MWAVSKYFETKVKIKRNEGKISLDTYVPLGKCEKTKVTKKVKNESVIIQKRRKKI